MRNISSTTTDNKYSAKKLFSSPTFYIALLPHILTIVFVLAGRLGYAEAFFIFFLELVIDIAVMALSILFTKTELVQKMYKGSRNKLFYALQTLLGGLGFCFIYGIFAVVIFAAGRNWITFSGSILHNGLIWLPFLAYLITKLINLVINIYKYRLGQRLLVDDGKSLVINLLALVIFVMPGYYLIALLGVFIGDFQIVAILVLFVVRAYLDAAMTNYQNDAEAAQRQLYGENQVK